jgi:antibiotic biosynthesis monooxygenase (ABM) superfamily enzyme
VIYTLLRLLLFAAALGVGYLVGLRSWLLVLAAVVVAFAVAYLVLPKQKDAAARWLAERAERRRTGREGLSRIIDEDAAAEDWDDEPRRNL